MARPRASHRRERRGGTRRALLAVAVLVVALATVVGIVRLPTVGESTAAAPSASSTSAARSAAGGSWAPITPHPSIPQPGALPADLRPVSVQVPAIGVQSDLIPLNVDGTGALVPPDRYDIAGWFTAGVVPGEIGPAVIAGHVDSRAGPGIFYRLEEMQVGDTVTVTRSDGTVAAFAVVRVAQYPKTAFPTAEVYGPTPDRELRLITCGGDFDRSRRSYVDNIVVYAVRT